MKTRKQKKAGFTLVELMVVAIIVAILAAVAIPLMGGNKYRAIATEAQAGLGSIATATKVYFVEKGAWPTAVSDLTTLSQADLNGKYFDGGDFQYTATGTNWAVQATANATAGDAAGSTISLNYAGDYTGTGKFADLSD